VSEAQPKTKKFIKAGAVHFAGRRPRASSFYGLLSWHGLCQVAPSEYQSGSEHGQACGARKRAAEGKTSNGSRRHEEFTP
jgi:hypothetical protein